VQWSVKEASGITFHLPFSDRRMCVKVSGLVMDSWRRIKGLLPE
ncbi:hypothetical protein Tco_1581818, partial [Tanacetum coccineum]